MQIPTILIFLALAICLSAQTTLEVNYYKPLEAVGGGYMEKNSEYVLYCNPRQSLFVFQTSETYDSFHELNDTHFEVNFRVGDGYAWVYKDFVKKAMTQYAMTMQENQFLIDDVIHPIQWQILNESKSIEGIAVQKARCAHRGRFYTAWFAPTIPINNGPWKLGGLPGLILEAYDDEKVVVFLFKSMKQTNAGKITIPASKGRRIDLKSYLDISEKEFKQFMDFMEGRVKSVSGDTEINFSLDSYISWEYLE